MRGTPRAQHLGPSPLRWIALSDTILGGISAQEARSELTQQTIFPFDTQLSRETFTARTKRITPAIAMTMATGTHTNGNWNASN